MSSVTRRSFPVLLSILVGLVVLVAVGQPAAAQSTTADVVYGQLGSFSTNTSNDGGISASSLYFPEGLALDSSGNLYVADAANNRVLFYPSGSTTATRVYGQGGSFTTNAENKGGVSANSLNEPTTVALDSSGNLYVADDANSRVLFYPSGSTTATRVYGQGGSFTTNTQNNGGISANSLSNPSLTNYGGYDSPVTDVGFFDPTCSPNLAYNGCTNESGHVPSWYTCTNGCSSGFAYDAAGDICKNASGQPVTTFLSQQTGQQTAFTRANVTTESQYRAIQTANAMRGESPVPTYIYTIGLSESITQSTADFLAQLANDPSYPNYNPNQPAGEFFYIPNCPGSTCTADLTAAFQAIAARLL